ncbi:penicillin-binding protein 1A [Hyphococcus flavus]|uniref:Penicillin-binding protein 1A n=1 Tax=Hyphococcus flavus TaxID=1866326 RepID=A0AAE9ZBB1_9PROT|nr:penicillin-binding protein 1A [Hyphococcus flavus]WDI30871.1 penicillin-binding protein 1A [Hyphococcus flavus]
MNDHNDDKPEKKAPTSLGRLSFTDEPEEESSVHSGEPNDEAVQRDAAEEHQDGDEAIESDMFSRRDTSEQTDDTEYAEDDVANPASSEVEIEVTSDDEDMVLEEDDVVGAEPLVAPVRAPAKEPKKEPKAAKPSRAGSLGFFMLRLVGLGFAVGALGIIGAAGFSAWYLNQLNQDLPDYQQLAEYAPPVTTRVYAGDGSLVAEFARERRLFVPIESMPDYVKHAFVSAEDKGFYEHSGIDLRGIVRAQLSNIGNILNGRRLEGGSTITQQVAKNFLLSSEQRVERKLREMLIARKMERTFTKDHILELYLNEIYLGNRSYGVAAAALNYFDKSLNDLTIAEASYLAAITKGPSNYHPVDHEARAVERRNYVINRLREDQQITDEEAEEALAQPLGAKIAPPLGARDWTMEYFAEEVRKQIVELYGVEALYDGGLAVRTSVDPHMQKEAGEALRRWLVEYDQRHGWRGPLSQIELGDTWTETLEEEVDQLRNARKVSDDMAPWRPAVVLSVSDASAQIGFPDGEEASVPVELLWWARDYISANDIGEEVAAASDVLNTGDVIYVEKYNAETLPKNDPESEEEEAKPTPENAYALRQAPSVNGGLIAMDPHTGRVLAMVGGFSFQMSEFNRAVQAERQPGSTFKPFVYSVALDSGYNPSSIVLDAPFVAPSLDSWYKPGNYIEGRHYGPSTLRLGIEQSRNTMTARLAQDLGIGRILDYVNRFNLSDDLPRELAISLGAGETTLMRITAGYSVFVNGGKGVEPVLIDRIQDRSGKTIYKRDQRECDACNAEFWSEQTQPQLADTRRQVMDPRTAYQITSILEGVVIRGTGSAVRRASNKPLAGKTGTTNDYKDAWFVGFSPDLAAGVYVGFDMPQTLGQGEAGGTVAAPIFADFMVDALKDEAGIPFRVPSGIRLVRVNARTGKPAGPGDGNVILEAFKPNDEPGADRVDDYALDPLSAAPRANGEEEEDLNGLY